MTYIGKNNNLDIYLLSFTKPNEFSECFYFLEMSTTQATEFLLSDRKIVCCELVAYTSDNKYLDEQIVDGFKTVGDFNNFFSNNPDYYIHDCKIESENGVTIISHDDGEVSIQYANDDSDQIITRIFEKCNLDRKIIDSLKSNPGHYLAIDDKSNIIADYESFDDYLGHGRV